MAKSNDKRVKSCDSISIVLGMDIMDGVAYYDHDFDWESWALEASSFPLPEITTESDDHRASEAWDPLFRFHKSGTLYKPRKYLVNEFREYISSSHIILEIGSGYGSSLFSLLKLSFEKYFASDCSADALATLSRNPSFDPLRVVTSLWDFTMPPPPCLLTSRPDTCLAVFSLSAALPSVHSSIIQHVKALLSTSDATNCHFLFRDYGLHDMTMYRHPRRIAERTFMRCDGTIAHYFTIEEMRHLMEQQGFEVRELRYATVINENKKEKKVMRRVFVHGVFQLNRSCLA